MGTAVTNVEEAAAAWGPERHGLQFTHRQPPPWAWRTEVSQGDCAPSRGRRRVSSTPGPPASPCHLNLHPEAESGTTTLHKSKSPSDLTFLTSGGFFLAQRGFPQIVFSVKPATPGPAAVGAPSQAASSLPLSLLEAAFLVLEAGILSVCHKVAPDVLMWDGAAQNLYAKHEVFFCFHS